MILGEKLLLGDVLLERQRDLAELEGVGRRERHFLDEDLLAVSERAEAAARVLEEQPSAVVEPERRVLAGDADVADDEVAGREAADHRHTWRQLMDLVEPTLVVAQLKHVRGEAGRRPPSADRPSPRSGPRWRSPRSASCRRRAAGGRRRSWTAERASSGRHA